MLASEMSGNPLSHAIPHWRTGWLQEVWGPDELLAACIEGREPEALRIAASPTFDSWFQSDTAGMTALHHAARKCMAKAVAAIAEREPELVGCFTSPSRRPSHWTPLHCVCDLPATPGQLETVRRLAPCTFSTHVGGLLKADGEHFSHHCVVMEHDMDVGVSVCVCVCWCVKRYSLMFCCLQPPSLRGHQ